MVLHLEGYEGVLAIIESEFKNNSPKQGQYPNILDLQSQKEVETTLG